MIKKHGARKEIEQQHTVASVRGEKYNVSQECVPFSIDRNRRFAATPLTMPSPKIQEANNTK